MQSPFTLCRFTDDLGTTRATLGRYLSARQLTCRAPASAYHRARSLVPSASIVEVSFNGVDFTSTTPPRAFEFLGEYSLQSLHPVQGPEQGGTTVVIQVVAGASVACATQKECFSSHGQPTHSRNGRFAINVAVAHAVPFQLNAR